jgi:hypothetical protein
MRTGRTGFWNKVYKVISTKKNNKQMEQIKEEIEMEDMGNKILDNLINSILAKSYKELKMIDYQNSSDKQREYIVNKITNKMFNLDFVNSVSDEYENIIFKYIKKVIDNKDTKNRIVKGFIENYFIDYLFELKVLEDKRSKYTIKGQLPKILSKPIRARVDGFRNPQFAYKGVIIIDDNLKERYMEWIKEKEGI